MGIEGEVQQRAVEVEQQGIDVIGQANGSSHGAV